MENNCLIVFFINNTLIHFTTINIEFFGMFLVVFIQFTVIINVSSNCIKNVKDNYRLNEQKLSQVEYVIYS